MRPRVAGAWIIGLLILLSVAFASQRFSSDREEIDFTSFDAQVRAHKVKSIDVYGSVAYGEFVEAPLVQASGKETKATSKDGKKATDKPQRASKEFWVTLPSENVDPEFVRQWREAGVQSIAFHKPRNYSDLLLLIWLGLLVFLVIGGWGMARRARDQMMSGGMMSGVLRSPARRYPTEGPRVTFSDVAGLGNAKKDLQEIVEFLRDPTKFQKLGARVPKGVL